jgi:hypothetical protein
MWREMEGNVYQDWRIAMVMDGGCVLFHGIVFRIRVQRRSETDKKAEGEVVPVHAVKAYGGSKGIAPLTLNLGAR